MPTNNERDLMVPDTNPTDEELHLVMRAALEVAMQRKKVSDAWMQQRLSEEVEKAQKHQNAFAA
jgi:hypothetical protein